MPAFATLLGFLARLREFRLAPLTACSLPACALRRICDTPRFVESLSDADDGASAGGLSAWELGAWWPPDWPSVAPSFLRGLRHLGRLWRGARGVEFTGNGVGPAVAILIVVRQQMEECLVAKVDWAFEGLYEFE